MRVAATLVLLALIGTAGFCSLGLLNPQFSLRTEVLVEAPVQRSFAVFRDLRRLDVWLSGFVDIQYLRGEPDGVGGVYRLTMEDGGRRTFITEEITSLVENEAYSASLESPMMVAETTTVFAAASGGTRITTESVIRGKGIFYRSLLYLMRTQLAERQDTDFDQLRRLIESGG